ncbi:protein disulfide oxidoreductase [Thioalkalivibrio paradoxus]|uniref:Alkyl hydroperoxide reductase n=1 Tax=Thioalkalivibrio paradoxus ARh 1 TaxID=713585 RepID=W0DF86_9GAMM|nr:protein disulfide oxidoreductase [Thioalkalivibrio paradoxus]AHE97294.1 alkyl hydroperoxide reductase [Thioalkalivibrio paradoxus ARh 1]
MNTAVKKRRPVWRWVLEIAIVIGVVLLVRAWIARDLAQGPAPAFEAQLLDGTPVSLAHFADEPMLLHFWATWCPICRLEEGEILRLSRSHPVLTVAMQSGSEAEVEAHLTERERKLAVVNDPGGDLARTYGVRAVPSTFIIDRDGEIVFRKQGYAPPLELRFRLWLARWL